MKDKTIKAFGLFSILLLIFLQSSFGKTETVYSFEVERITGQKLPLKKMEGRPILIVNIATRCGFTPQLKALQALNKQFAPKGLVILGVPSNDFGGQTPQGNKEVKKFCQDSYGVTFPLTSKMIVSGVKKHSLFQFLTKAEGEISWNFEKFLIDRKGNLVKRFRSGQNPLGKDLVNSLEKLF
ncbi:MAG: glutathione peroxidase [Bdellovibrionota bacterium]|nr:glutathione peroxidase [Bdellovibrionota bacterium]